MREPRTLDRAGKRPRRTLKLALLAFLVLGVVFSCVLLLWLSDRNSFTAFVEQLGGERWRHPNENDLVYLSPHRQPTAIYVFRADSAMVRREMEKELKGRGWFDLDDSAKRQKIRGLTTFARSKEFQVKRSWGRESDDWIDFESAPLDYHGAPYPVGTTCAVAICIEPSWFEKQLQALRQYFLTSTSFR